MQRRTVLKGAAGIGAVGIGATVLTGSAAAELENYELSGTEITGESDDGSLDKLLVWAENGIYGYQGLESSAANATIELQAVVDDTAHTVASTTALDDEETELVHDSSASGLPFARLEGDVLAHPDLDASDFEATTDGEERSEDVTIRLAVAVTPGEHADVTRSEDETLGVVMTNTPSEAAGDGDTGGEVVTDSFPSTNAENRDAGVQHVEHLESTPDSVTLAFNGTSGYDYFEVRVDGEFVEDLWIDSAGDRSDYPHQTVDADGVYDPISSEELEAIEGDDHDRDLQHAGFYPGNDGLPAEYNTEAEYTFEDVEKVEVRFALGSDAGNRFGWTAFYPLG